LDLKSPLKNTSGGAREYSAGAITVKYYGKSAEIHQLADPGFASGSSHTANRKGKSRIDPAKD
jgi:hypothetical protein